MALSQEELQNIVNAVLSALETNSLEIQDLTPVLSLNDDDVFEVAGGKKVSYGVLKDVILKLAAENAEQSDSSIRRQIRSLKSSVEANLESINDINHVLDIAGRPGGLAVLGEDGLIPDSNLPSFIKVASEDAMEELIAADAVKSGRVYYTEEE